MRFAPIHAAPPIALAVTLLTGGCTVEWTRDHPLYCRLDEQRMIRDTLYFGLSVPGGGEIAEADWRDFESGVLATAFPAGFTVLEGRGAWRGADDALIGEPARIVIVVHADDKSADDTIRSAVERYRAMFRQEAVLRERGAVCVTL